VATPRQVKGVVRGSSEEGQASGPVAMAIPPVAVGAPRLNPRWNKKGRASAPATETPHGCPTGGGGGFLVGSPAVQAGPKAWVHHTEGAVQATAKWMLQEVILRHLSRNSLLILGGLIQLRRISGALPPVSEYSVSASKRLSSRPTTRLLGKNSRPVECMPAQMRIPLRAFHCYANLCHSQFQCGSRRGQRVPSAFLSPLPAFPLSRQGAS